MAWDDGDFFGEHIMAGDKPADEFGLCLKRICAAYEDRFERKPTVAELLYSFSIVLRSTPEQYCSDPAAVERMMISLSGKKAGATEIQARK
ncbi:hypothetical protein [Massilia sp. CCM 8734]|uniref:hypothetical protein n=1 Tax=Massilia sp. CCM 8734 TaxID=2609283 RepID=UPI0014200FF3|nr:hypothetical protein [Massilia sp. CCM 8734]NHZ94452.1 hypothetical protein [Massilia sp. CCM 8734]